jgi:phage repressor protein C with HTH and peptisase S24 domain
MGLHAETFVRSVHPPRGETPDQPVVRSADAGETVEILQLDLSLSMGPGTAIEDFVESEMVAFDAAALRRITRTPSDRLRFVTGIGTSHEPKFQSADQFLIDINDRQLTRIDGYYWITFDGAHALKRLRPLGNGMIQVISENPDYAPMELERAAVRIEGRAIWFARGL